MSDINKLYSVLFDTLQDLRDPEKKIDTTRVKLINETAKNIVDAAKTEVDCMRVTGTRGSGFMPTRAGAPALVSPPPAAQGVAGQLMAANVTTHRMEG